MLRALHSEIIKHFSVVSTYVYIVLIAGCVAGPTWLNYLLDGDMTGTEWQLLTSMVPITIMIAVIFGASSLGNDQTNRMDAHAYGALRNRSQFLLAKSLVVAVLIFGSTLIGYLGAAAGQLIAGNDIPTAPHAAQIWLFLLGPALFALLSIGITALTHSKVAAMGIIIAWMLVLENLIAYAPFDWCTKIARFFPFMNWSAIVLDQAIPGANFSTSESIGIVLIWIVAFFGIGWAVLQRRDVK